MNTTSLINEALRLADESDENRMSSLGLAVLKSEYGFADEPGEPEKRRAGRTWFRDNQERIRAAICENAAVLVIRRSPNASRIELAGALVDALCLVFKAPTVASIVAIVLVKGLDSFCVCAPDSTAS